MTERLTALEADGFSFSIKGAMLAVSAPKELLNPQAVDQLRQWRNDLLAELCLRNFCNQVQQFSFINHGLGLCDEAIKNELDEIDRAYLTTASFDERTTWAQLLAYRLCKELLEEEPPWRGSGGKLEPAAARTVNLC